MDGGERQRPLEEGRRTEAIAIDLTAAALNRSGLGIETAISAHNHARGGAMRDLARHEEAMALAFEAHALERSSYRPCTLWGALHMEAGKKPLVTAGTKGEELGAPSEAIDGELCPDGSMRAGGARANCRFFAART